MVCWVLNKCCFIFLLSNHSWQVGPALARLLSSHWISHLWQHYISCSGPCSSNRNTSGNHLKLSITQNLILVFLFNFALLKSKCYWFWSRNQRSWSFHVIKYAAILNLISIFSFAIANLLRYWGRNVQWVSRETKNWYSVGVFMSSVEPVYSYSIDANLLYGR
jgi:hypothetical protein